MRRPETHWCNWKGEPIDIVGPGPPPLLVAETCVLARPCDAIFRDPSRFIPGELHNNVEQWKLISAQSNVGDTFVPLS